MQALILAAGQGKRLWPLTQHTPKPLVSVHGTPILNNALDCLAVQNVCEAVIVVGYRAQAIKNHLGDHYKGMALTYVYNPDYARTNNIHSFCLAKDFINDDVLLLESDVFFHCNLLSSLLSGKGDCNILTSPYNAKTMDGTVIFADHAGHAKELVVKNRQNPGFDYRNAFKTVNLYAFKKHYIQNKFFPAALTYLNTQSNSSYYELVLGSLIYFGNDDIRVVNVPENQWCEIDSYGDLLRAEQMFSRKGALDETAAQRKDLPHWPAIASYTEAI